MSPAPQQVQVKRKYNNKKLVFKKLYYYKDEPVTNDDRFITDFTANNNSDSFKFENN